MTRSGEVNLCMAGLFNGEIWLPEAICTEIFEYSTVDFEKIVERVVKRKSVRHD